MNPRILLTACLAGLCLPAGAAGIDYDLLIVACKATSCERIAEQTISGSLADKIEFSRNGLQLQIEPLANRLNELDTRVSVKFHPDGYRPAAEKFARQQATVESLTLKQGMFTALSAFADQGTFYRVWARLATIR